MALLHKYILHAKVKARVFAVNFSVNFLLMALPIVPKVEFNFEIMLYITIFLYESPGSCFKSAICNQNSLESAPIALFLRQLKEGNVFHQKGLMTQYTLILHSEATLTLICVFPFHLKFQRSNFSTLGMKTRPWKFLDLACNAP